MKRRIVGLTIRYKNSPGENGMGGKDEFARLFDEALRIVDARLRQHEPTESLSVHQLQVLRGVLAKQREEILKNDVEPYKGQLYGPMKGVIDWGEPVESELLNSLHKIEKYYEGNF